MKVFHLTSALFLPLFCLGVEHGEKTVLPSSVCQRAARSELPQPVGTARDGGRSQVLARYRRGRFQTRCCKLRIIILRNVYDPILLSKVAFIWEDEQLRDEPPSGNPNAIDEFDYDSLSHVYSNNLPETRDIVLAGFDRTIKSYSDADGYPRYCYLEKYHLNFN